MASDEENTPPDAEDESWTEVGEAPPPAETSPGEQVSAEDADAAEEDIQVYKGKQPTPPWKLSRNLGIVGLLLMAVLFVFPELRRFNTPWASSVPTAYLMLVFPAVTLLWALVGLIAKRFREERSRSLLGLVLALLTVGLAYAVIVTDPTRGADATLGASNDRLEMTEEELREWRIEKLNR